MRPPPKWVRRIVIAPVVVTLGLVALAVTPLALIIFLAVISLLPHVRTLRVVWLAFVYLVWDALLVIALFVLWIASGFGWKLRAPAFQRAHYRLAAFALRSLFWIFGSSLRLTIATSGAEGDEGADRASIFAPGIPLIVASRHAGPGDSFILIHMLLNRVQRMPRIVLARKLQWDPGDRHPAEQSPVALHRSGWVRPEADRGRCGRRSPDRRSRHRDDRG